jgi:hypothetical protein
VLLDKSTLKEGAIYGYKSTKVKPGAAGLVRAYKTALKAVCLRVNFDVEMCPGGLDSKEVEIRREELEGESVGRKITTLKTKACDLVDLILDILYELYSNHGLDLLDRCIRLYIYITCNHLLNLFLT